MGDVLTFTPRPKPVAPPIPAPLTGPDLRASLEEAAQVALDAADRIIAVLDSMDGDADHEDGGTRNRPWPRPRTPPARRSCGCGAATGTARPSARSLVAGGVRRDDRDPCRAPTVGRAGQCRLGSRSAHRRPVQVRMMPAGSQGGSTSKSIAEVTPLSE